MKKIIVIFVSFYLFYSNLYSQDCFLYVYSLNENIKPLNEERISNDEDLNQIFKDFEVVNYYQSFPKAKNIELQNYYEIHFKGNIDSLENLLKCRKIFDKIYRCDYYRLAACNSPIPINDTWIVNNLVNNDALDLLDAQCAWTITTGSSEIVVGVIDTEFETNHEDLENTFTGVVGTQVLFTYHGTSVSSCVATGTNNNKGIAGIGYNTRVKGYHCDGGSLWNQIWQAYLDGIKIISVSWWGSPGTPVNAIAVKEMTNNGVVLVFSAGNGVPHNSHSAYADIPGVIIVSGVNANNMHGPTGYSHSGWVDVCALSTNVAVCKPGNTYGVDNGTSFSAPQVSGVVALIRAVNNSLLPADIENIIKTTTEPIVDADLFHGQIGTGRVNAYKSLLKAICYSGLPEVEGTITQNTIWNTDLQAIGTIIIPYNVILTISSIVKFEKQVSITIQPGGKLIIDGGTLTNACENELWQGIIVQSNPSQPVGAAGQGAIQILNGGTIKNAMCGVAVQGGATISATNANFVNNKAGVKLLPLANGQSGTSGTLNGTSFIIDEDFFLAAP
ncbi:MAG: S8/S53 family peptidase [Bacteroidales bacterium]|jgi:subtilisin family serine protease|nr:S8/S53 family peptidase [Bacteroidales bacterium]